MNYKEETKGVIGEIMKGYKDRGMGEEKKVKGRAHPVPETRFPISQSEVSL